ncbi:hypothetical protein [Crossiella sp. CA198]|uniref:hypothetical protein n=1 Tax=Crossiella sp. CA198 TaxID=3455607 RepID=UPI003F8D68BC
MTDNPMAYTISDYQTDHWSLKGICDDTEMEFKTKIDAALTALAIWDCYQENPPGSEPVLNLFGYGEVREVLTGPDDTGYFWGHEAAEALGWDPAEFAKWAEDQWRWDIVAQREADEKTGTLGWDCIQHHPMNVTVWQGEGRSQDYPAAMRGEITKYWCDIYLIHTSRIMPLMRESPWGKEWFQAVKPMLAWGFEKSGLAAMMGQTETVTISDNSAGESSAAPNGQTLADAIAETRGGLTEQEARDRAMRGPSIPEDMP